MKVFRLTLSVVMLLASVVGGVFGDTFHSLWWGCPLLTVCLFAGVASYLVGMITLMNWNGVSKCPYR